MAVQLRDLDIHSVTTDRNRRFVFSIIEPKGTRSVEGSATIETQGLLDTNSVRVEASALMISACVDMWEEIWGPIRWDRVQMIVTHTTMQVVCCLWQSEDID